MRSSLFGFCLAMLTILAAAAGSSCYESYGRDSTAECVMCHEDSFPDEDMTVDYNEDNSPGEDLSMENIEDRFTEEDLTVEYSEDNLPIVECSEDRFPVEGDRCSKADHDEYIACRHNYCVGCEPTCLCEEDLRWSCSILCIDNFVRDGETEICDIGTPPRCRLVCDG